MLEEAVPVVLVGGRLVVLAGRGIGRLSILSGSVGLGSLIGHRCVITVGFLSLCECGDEVTSETPSSSGAGMAGAVA